MTKEEIIDSIARLNSETWRDREDVRTEIGKLLAELKKALEQPTSKVGKWDILACDLYMCSKCYAKFTHEFNYCPTCGAEMRGSESGL